MKHLRPLTVIWFTILIFSQPSLTQEEGSPSDYAAAVKNIIESERGADLSVKSLYLRFDEKGNRKEYFFDQSSKKYGAEYTLAVFDGEEKLMEVVSSGYGVKGSVHIQGKSSSLKQERLKEQILDTVINFEDLLVTNYTSQYVGAVVFKDIFAGEECLVLSLRPVSRHSRYSRLIVWAGIQDHLIRRIDYYEKGDSTTTKRMSAVEVKEFKGRKYRHKEEWVNFNDNRKALIEVKEISVITEPESVADPVSSEHQSSDKRP